MAYLGFAEDQIYEAAVNRQLNRNGSDVSPNGYRFGRIGVNRARGVKGFFRTMLELIAAAKTRRIEREMRIRGLRYRSVKLDGDRFVAD